MDYGRQTKPEGASMLPVHPHFTFSSSARTKPFATPSIDVPSFSAFQAQTSRVNAPSPVRRKPLPLSASPIIHRIPLSSGGRIIAVGEEDSTPYHRTSGEQGSSSSTDPIPSALPPSSISPPLVVRDLDQFPRGHSPLVTPNPQTRAFPAGETKTQPISRQDLDNSNSTPTRLHHARLASDPLAHESPKTHRATTGDGLQRAATMTTHLGVRPNALHIHGDQRLVFNPETQDPSVITKTPRSPGPNKLSSFFGWKTSSPIAEVSPSTYSGRSNSPNPSPAPSLPPHSPHSLPPSHKPLPRAIDVPKANADINAAYFADTGFPLPPQTGSASAQIAEMDEELREVSSELAGSIRRELELEDLVDKLQLEAQQGPELSRRTSDYFSDSGTSSIRYPLSEVGGAKTDDVAKLKRILEQEKAQFKLKMSQKLQDERTRRKMLEQHIQQLSDQLQHVDDERARSSNVAGRVRDLENALDDVRRRLLEERRGKENLEDLLTALRDETQQHRDERDNLRDEVVPQLQARVDGLEGESLEYQQLAYENARMQQELQSLRNANPNQQLTDENARMQQELQSLRNVNPNQQLMDENTRMQQELQSLRNENTTLMNARRLQLELQQNPRFTSIPEEDNLSPLSPGLKTDLTRSDSGARRNIMDGLIKGGALARSTSVSVKERESRESLADRVKDIEVQRDALHTALKRLLDRQNYHANEHDKKIRALELERDRALQNHSPRRMGYERDVLRGEISQLRRRADDALMQKWQCEKGLSGLKMDLDRAEQETSSLRSLLQEHDILIPEPPNRHSQEIENGSHATSASLERAYKELRATQALSISKLRELWGEAPSSADDADTAKTMDLLLRSMSDAEAERDYAQKQAELYRAQAESLQEAESFHTGENAGLADQLRASASRVERLASQVRVQLEANRELRVRLAEAIGRGEREQKTSASRINSMQGKLKTLEDKLMVAQQHSEEAFAQHEEEVRELHENHNMQLQRLKGGLRAPTIFSPKSPISPMFSPRLDKTTSGAGMSMTEALRTQILERKVVELEGALGDADKEMEEVVSRMNMAQIEVMELQSARDEAMRQTRKLQAAINAEREKVDSLMK